MDIKRLRLLSRSGVGFSECLAVREKTPVDRRPILGRLAVAVEEVGF